MNGELRHRRAAQILISGAAFEPVSQPVARGTLGGGWKRRTTKRERAGRLV